MDQKNHHRSRRLRLAALAGGTIAFVAACGAVAPDITVECDTRQQCLTLEALADGAPLPESIHILDYQGATLADVAGPRRRALQVTEVPQVVADAFVAVEDRRYWHHRGVDFMGVARAAMVNATSGEVQEGASTIPMQLVRTIWAEELREVGPWRRKLIEARLAPRLVAELGRERVLTLYLNAIYLGDGVYGVEEAARHYFGVPAAELNLAQVATLVGMTRGPEHYHPRKHPRRALARRNITLGILADAGVVSRKDAALARGLPLGVVEEAERPGRSHLTAAVTRQIREVAPELAGLPGLRVHTTVDPAVQKAGEKALAAQLAAIEAGQAGAFRGGETPLQGAAVAVDPHTGAIRAWIGGRDFTLSEFDRVDQARRQVGSLVKPFIVALAHERGAGVLSMVSTEAIALESGGEIWSPADHVEATRLTVRDALVQSSNRAMVHLGQALGAASVQQVGSRVGMAEGIPAVPSSFLGSFEATLVDVVGAYASLGNGGQRVEPFLLERIESADGRVLWKRDVPEPAVSMDSVSAYVVLDALQEVVNRGTAWRARAAGYHGPAAGKTGTTNEGRDAWFVGLTPELVSGVWVGFDDPRPITRGGSGGTLAAPAWGSWMAELQQDGRVGAERWHRPAGVRTVFYDPESGRAYDEDCGMDGLRTAAVGASTQLIDSCPSRLERWFQSLWQTVSPDRDPVRRPVVVRPLVAAGGR